MRRYEVGSSYYYVVGRVLVSVRHYGIAWAVGNTLFSLFCLAGPLPRRPGTGKVDRAALGVLAQAAVVQPPRRAAARDYR